MWPLVSVPAAVFYEHFDSSGFLWLELDHQLRASGWLTLSFETLNIWNHGSQLDLIQPWEILSGVCAPNHSRNFCVREVLTWVSRERESASGNNIYISPAPAPSQSISIEDKPPESARVGWWAPWPRSWVVSPHSSRGGELYSSAIWGRINSCWALTWNKDPSNHSIFLSRSFGSPAEVCSFTQRLQIWVYRRCRDWRWTLHRCVKTGFWLAFLCFGHEIIIPFFLQMLHYVNFLTFWRIWKNREKLWWVVGCKRTSPSLSGVEIWVAGSGGSFGAFVHGWIVHSNGKIPRWGLGSLDFSFPRGADHGDDLG